MCVIKNEFQFKKYKKAMATVETLKNRSCPEQALAGVDIPDSTQPFQARYGSVIQNVFTL